MEIPVLDFRFFQNDLLFKNLGPKSVFSQNSFLFGICGFWGRGGRMGAMAWCFGGEVAMSRDAAVTRIRQALHAHIFGSSAFVR